MIPKAIFHSGVWVVVSVGRGRAEEEWERYLEGSMGEEWRQRYPR